MATINVYLEYRRLLKFNPPKNPPKKTSFQVLGTDIFYEKDRWYIPLGSVTDRIPGELFAMEVECTLHERISGNREAGFYRLETATAELDFPAGEDCKSQLRIQAEKFQDLKELFNRIRTGTIRPRPEDSFEGAQTGQSHKELEVELRQTRVLLGASEEDSRVLQEKVQQFKQEFAKTTSGLRQLQADHNDCHHNITHLRGQLATARTQESALQKKVMQLSSKVERVHQIVKRLETSLWPRPFCRSRRELIASIWRAISTLPNEL